MAEIKRLVSVAPNKTADEYLLAITSSIKELRELADAFGTTGNTVVCDQLHVISRHINNAAYRLREAVSQTETGEKA